MAGTTLWRVISPARYVDPWGHVTDNQGKYVHVTEKIETFENGEFKTLDNGYGTPTSVWQTPVLESNDGRTWIYIANTVSYHGGGWYKGLFDESRTDSSFKIGPTINYYDERMMRREYLCCVDENGQPLTIEEALR